MADQQNESKASTAHILTPLRHSGRGRMEGCVVSSPGSTSIMAVRLPAARFYSNQCVTQYDPTCCNACDVHTTQRNERLSLHMHARLTSWGILLPHRTLIWQCVCLPCIVLNHSALLIVRWCSAGLVEQCMLQTPPRPCACPTGWLSAITSHGT